MNGASSVVSVCTIQTSAQWAKTIALPSTASCAHRNFSSYIVPEYEAIGYRVLDYRLPMSFKAKHFCNDF
jgi:hypothetical protein